MQKKENAKLKEENEVYERLVAERREEDGEQLDLDEAEPVPS